MTDPCEPTRWQRSKRSCHFMEPSQLADWAARFRELATAAADSRLRTFYHHPPPDGGTPIRDVPLLALDLETTGLDAGRDVIVSIGLIPLRHDRIQCSGARHWLVQPDRSPDEIAATIHGITHAELSTAPPFDDRFDALLQAMAGKIVVAHCAAIERRFLSAASEKLTGEPLVFPVIDTLRLEAMRYPAGRLDGLLRWFRKPNKPSLRLDAARMRYGLPAYRPHHALTDALATAELLQAQLQAGDGPATPVSRLWG